MVKIRLERLPDNVIATAIDLSDVKSRGELSHILAELEVIKIKVLKRWSDYGE